MAMNIGVKTSDVKLIYEGDKTTLWTRGRRVCAVTDIENERLLDEIIDNASESSNKELEERVCDLEDDIRVCKDDILEIADYAKDANDGLQSLISRVSAGQMSRDYIVFALEKIQTSIQMCF